MKIKAQTLEVIYSGTTFSFEINFLKFRSAKPIFAFHKGPISVLSSSYHKIVPDTTDRLHITGIQVLWDIYIMVLMMHGAYQYCIEYHLALLQLLSNVLAHVKLFVLSLGSMKCLKFIYHM